MAKPFKGKIALDIRESTPVVSDYADRGTFAFTGGTIDTYVDHVAQVRAWLLTD